MTEVLFWTAVIVTGGVAALALGAVALLGAIAALAPSDLMDLRERR